MNPVFDMEIDELLEFISQENDRLRAYHSGLDADNAPLIQTVKLNEEIGELCDSVLAYDSLQRSKKLAEFEEQEIEDEVADVIITTLLLADSIDVDIEEALENKINAVEERYE